MIKCNSILKTGLGEIHGLLENRQVRRYKEFGLWSGLNWLELIIMV